MKAISLGEWERLPIREEGGESAVTPKQVDQLIAAAIEVERKLGSGTGEGASVLVRTHRELWARQIVGVISTPDVTLEILPVDRRGKGTPLAG